MARNLGLMMETNQDAPMGGQATDGERAVIDASDLLRLAAAPTLALMALLTKLSGSGLSDSICSANGRFGWTAAVVPNSEA